MKNMTPTQIKAELMKLARYLTSDAADKVIGEMGGKDPADIAVRIIRKRYAYDVRKGMLVRPGRSKDDIKPNDWERLPSYNTIKNKLARLAREIQRQDEAEAEARRLTNENPA